MSDVLEVLKKLEDNLFAKYGNPLATYKKTQSDIHDTHYVGRLMAEMAHKWISPSKISGEKEDRAYYSERALHDAFLAGRLIGNAERAKMRKELIAELKAELHDLIDNSLMEH